MNAEANRAMHKEPRIRFVSFGSNRVYGRMARRTLNDLKRIWPGAETHVWSPPQLPTFINDYAVAHPRGYGYWIWKPFIVLASLTRVRPGDVVVYADGRSRVPESGEGSWLHDFMDRPEIDCAAWQMHHPEHSWTTGDVFDLLGVELASPEASRGQYAAGILAVRNSPRGFLLAANWWSRIVHQPQLFRDEPSETPNHHSFVENRHDQSALSLLIKQGEARDLVVQTLSDEDIYSPSSIQPHGKPKPQPVSTWIPRARRRLRALVRADGC